MEQASQVTPRYAMKMCQLSGTYAGCYNDHIAKMAFAPQNEAEAAPNVHTKQCHLEEAVS